MIHYNLGSGSLLAQIHARWHEAGMAAGATTGDILIGSSAAAAQDFSCNPGPCRWGDYAGATPDPVPDDTVWGSNQLIALREWQQPALDHPQLRDPGVPRIRAAAQRLAAPGLARTGLHRSAWRPTAPMDPRSPSAHVPRRSKPRRSSRSAPPTPTVSRRSRAAQLRLAVVPGDPVTPADEADVNATLSLEDVRRQGTLADYAGELQAALAVRLTDGASGPSQSDRATVSDLSFRITVPCAPTAGTAGSTCSVATSFDAVVPGSAQERKRSIWALDQVEVFDGGADGLASTTPNTLFAVQGVFVP